MARPRRNKAAPRAGTHPSPALRVTSLVVLKFCRAVDQRSGGRLPLPLQSAPDPNSLEDPSKGAHSAEAEEVPGGEQKVGRPPSTRRRTPLSPVLWEPDPGLWPRLISNTKPGSGGPFYPCGGWPTRAPGRREESPEPPGSQPDPRLRKAIKLARARTPTSTCARRARRAFGDHEKLAILSLPSSHRCRRPHALCWSHPRPRPAASR